MDDVLARLFNDFDRGTISRRRLFQALGIAAVSTPLARAFGQGSCANTARDTTAVCNHTTWKAPFERTGWKTVWLDHFNIQVADAEAEAAFYVALMGWKVRSNDGKVIWMDIGNLGGAKITGGYSRPAATGGRGGGGGGRGGGGAGGAGGAAGAAGAGGRGGAAGAGGGRAGGDSAAGAAAGRGRGGGRAGGAAGGAAGAGAGGGGGGSDVTGDAPGATAGRAPACTTPRTPAVPNAAVTWDSFAFGIDQWDTKAVEKALKDRGLDPVADHSGDNYRSFHVKDPDGFDVAITNGTRANRRATPANGKLNVALPFEATNYKTMFLDHISFGVTSYKESVAFYEALLGWKGLADEGSLNETEISPQIGALLIRGANALAPNYVPPQTRRASIGHTSFGITPFDADKVNAELCKRGLNARADTGAVNGSPAKEKDIHTASYKSYHTTTPNGFDLQISDKITPTSGKRF